MPNHYHLLLFVQTERFDKAMQALGVSYAKAINTRHRRVGPLFQGRFRAKPVDKEEYLLHLSRYIHLNPVMGGLVGKPEEWAYSSYQEYIGSRQDPWLWTERILFQGVSGFFEKPGAFEHRAYREFVESYVEDLAIAHLRFEDG